MMAELLVPFQYDYKLKAMWVSALVGATLSGDLASILAMSTAGKAGASSEEKACKLRWLRGHATSVICTSILQSSRACHHSVH